MRILLLGKNGQVGWELQRSLAPLGAVVAVDRAEADLSRLDELTRTVRREAPDLIVNAAAYTAVDKAESEPEIAMRVNGEAVGILAEEAKKRGALLVHYSTDYVFDGGKPGFYVEDDVPNPINVYGRSKLAGERAIREVGPKHLVFRTSWVYAARGGNFARTILRLARERDELKIVSDQSGAPTSAELIADVTALCVNSLAQCPERFGAAAGLYHLVAAGETSWHAYATFIVEAATQLSWPMKLAPRNIRPIATREYPLPAKRPANSRLATDKLHRVFGIELPHWQIHLKRVLQELGPVTKA